MQPLLKNATEARHQKQARVQVPGKAGCSQVEDVTQFWKLKEVRIAEGRYVQLNRFTEKLPRQE